MDGATLATLRGAAERCFQETATLYRLTGYTNVNGIQKPSYDSGTPVRFGWRVKTATRLDPASGRLVVVTHIQVSLPVAVTTGIGDYFVKDGVRFEVVTPTVARVAAVKNVCEVIATKATGAL